MKQTWRRLAALLCILCFFTLYGAAEDMPTAQELVAQWAETRYPDDVGNIYTDQGKLVIGLVDGSEARQEELRAMVSDPGSLAFDEAAYPYNDLLAVKEEISRELSSDEGLYSVGVGWTSAEGTGFGRAARIPASSSVQRRVNWRIIKRCMKNDTAAWWWLWRDLQPS